MYFQENIDSFHFNNYSMLTLELSSKHHGAQVLLLQSLDQTID